MFVFLHIRNNFPLTFQSLLSNQLSQLLYVTLIFHDPIHFRWIKASSLPFLLNILKIYHIMRLWRKYTRKKKRCKWHFKYCILNHSNIFLLYEFEIWFVLRFKILVHLTVTLIIKYVLTGCQGPAFSLSSWKYMFLLLLLLSRAWLGHYFHHHPKADVFWGKWEWTL